MQFKHKNPAHSFTTKGNGILNVLLLEIEITRAGDQSRKFTTRAIWDTGATNTVITQEIVDTLSLSQTGFKFVNTASHTNVKANTYIIDLFLKKDVKVQAVEVTVGTIAAEQGIHCLLGMDIITLGDFTITNFEGKTVLSFRIPSQHIIDYTAQMEKEREFIDRHISAKRGFNNPCICNSGKKFKNCHGKNLEQI